MKSVLRRPPRSAYSMRPSCVKPRLPPSPTTLAAQLATVDTQGVVGAVAGAEVGLAEAFTYVPMPPFQSRSAGT